MPLSENSQNQLQALDDYHGRAAHETMPESASPKKAERHHLHNMPSVKDISLTVPTQA